jgi:LysM repeat protein
MTNPNPFVPQGSLLSQQSKRQSRMKLAVFCVLAVSVTGLMAMLIQGCKRTPPVDTNPDTNSVPADTNPSVLPPDTNTLAEGSNTVPVAPISTNVPPVPIPTPMPAPVPVAPVAEAPSGGAEYVVVKGDTFAKIAKRNGVSVKALESANPTAQPTKLKVGQKLTLPVGSNSSGTSASATGVSSGTTDSGTELYVVKSGDTLTKIAKSHGTTVKAIKAANNLTTNRISVGKKLKIPSKAEAAAPVTPAPVDSTPIAPAPVTTPSVPVPTPAPAH